MKALAALLSFMVLLALPAGSLAGKIPAKTVFQADRIDDTRASVSRSGQGMIVLRVETPELPELLSKTRKNNGSLGQREDISSTANAEMPRNILWNSREDLFLSWGVATSEATGEFRARPSGEGFLPTETYTTPPCGRFQSTSLKPDGGILLACSANQGTAPNDNVILISSLPDFLSTSFEPEVVAQVGTDDTFIQPKTDVAPDGSMAVLWNTTRESAPGIFSSRIRAILSGDGDWIGSSTTNISFINSATGYVTGAKGVALSGGRAAVLWFEGDSSDPSYGRLNLAIINTSSTVLSSATISNKPVTNYSIVREGDRLLLAWSEFDGGMGDPSTTKIARYDTALYDEETLESNSQSDAGDLQINSRGDVLLPRGNGANISAWIKKAGRDSFSSPQTIIKNTTLSPDKNLQGVSMALDSKGDILASWIIANSDGSIPDRAYWGGLDFSKPGLSVKWPKKVSVGKKALFQSRAIDSSGIKSIRWRFAGKTKSGKSVRYKYQKPGKYRVRVVATDRAGNKKALVRTIRVR